MSHRRTTGIQRREALQVGFSGLVGLGMSSLAKSAPTPRTPKSVIVVYLTGAPSHIDTFDPKPDAPPEIRGDFGVIRTSVPGTIVSEHLPLLAKQAHKYAIVRTLSHKDNNHLVATHHVLTGHQQPGAFFDKVASRDDWPSYSAGLNYLRPSSDGTPAGVNLPTFLMEGPLTWPGQHGGFLGPKHDPWQISKDPNAKDFAVENLRPSAGLASGQLDDRRSLLYEVNAQQRWLAESAEGRKLTDQQDRAFALLSSGKVAQAFDLAQETPATRDRYGRHSFGQSLLLARRLVQSGVRVVQANLGRVQNWDTHGNNFGRLKNELLPPTDRGVAALLDDLDSSGMLADTLVMVLGEFGRTPKVSMPKDQKSAGRDHWAPCFFGLFAGAGVRGGQVVGRSDKTGAYPATNPYSPDDVGATVYHTLGVDPASEVRDRLNRPVTLNNGQVIRSLFTGAAG